MARLGESSFLPRRASPSSSELSSPPQPPLKTLAFKKKAPIHFNPGIELVFGKKNAAVSSGLPFPLSTPSLPTSAETVFCTLCKKPNQEPHFKLCPICREKGRRTSELSKWRRQAEMSEKQLRERGDEMGELERGVVEATARNSREKLNLLLAGGDQTTMKKRKSDSFLIQSAVNHDEDVGPKKKKRKSDGGALVMEREQESEMGKLKHRMKEKENVRLGSGTGAQNVSFMKKGSSSKNQVPGGTSTYTDKLGNEWPEFQTATEMYKFLSSQRSFKATSLAAHMRKKTPLNFRGCYSIVVKHDTDEKKRARLVVEEVRKIGKVSFYHKVPTYDSGTKITFRCTCLASKSASSTPQPQPTTSSASTPQPTKPTRAIYSSNPTVTVIHDPENPTLTHGYDAKGKLTWTKQSMSKPRKPLGVASSSSSASASVSPSVDSAAPSVIGGIELPPGLAKNEICGGKIVVSVERDMSHPVGIPGQRVCVEISHG